MRCFAYGSNMKTSRLENRLGQVFIVGSAVLDGYRFVFNKVGRDGTGKGNITTDAASVVEGVIFDLTEKQLLELDDIEKGYRRVLFPEIESFVYIAEPEQTRDGLSPSEEYFGYVYNGACEHHLSGPYIEFLKTLQP